MGESLGIPEVVHSLPEIQEGREHLASSHPRDPAPLGSASFLPKGSTCCHTTAWRVCPPCSSPMPSLTPPPQAERDRVPSSCLLRDFPQDSSSKEFGGMVVVPDAKPGTPEAFMHT